ncbi:MAG: anion permease [Kofleriaceae bacterium]|nr:anion permease [Myxococcales bacterium]MCB9565411.1 anion permease [Kofleriaceae bacterium]MCB9572847.1 anion permease [Kofleriaceae bacterium]
MDSSLVIACGTLALTVGLAVLRPTVREFRFSPGRAAVLGVVVLLATHLLSPRDLVAAARLQWRPLLALTCIMIMTGVVQEVGAFDRLAARIEHGARSRSAVHTFTVVFVISAVTPSLLNNDAAILLLTPLVVALTRRLYPGQPRVTMAFAFAVFLAPGVAPFIVSNPMNMIVAESSGLDFNSYAAVMLPISIAGAVLTYVILRVAYRRLLAATTPAAAGIVTTIHPHPAERPAVALLIVVFFAYPVGAALGGEIWFVAVAGACGSLALARAYRVAPMRKLTGHVSFDILAFLWGIFLVVQGLRGVGVVDGLVALYHGVPAASGAQLATIGATSAVGSALIDNHPMSILNMMAIDHTMGVKPLLAALVGGDIGPRLLPIGSLAGLLWMDLLRRQGIEIGIGRFLRLGTVVLIPTLTVSLLLLWAL